MSLANDFLRTKKLAGEVNIDISTEMAIDLLSTLGYKAEDEDDLLVEVADELQTLLTMALARSSAVREFIGNALVSHKQREAKTAAYNDEVRDPSDPAQTVFTGENVPDDYGISHIIDSRGVSIPFVFVVDWENGTMDPSHVVDSQQEGLKYIREQHDEQRSRALR